MYILLLLPTTKLHAPHSTVDVEETWRILVGNSFVVLCESYVYLKLTNTFHDDFF